MLPTLHFLSDIIMNGINKYGINSIKDSMISLGPSPATKTLKKLTLHFLSDVIMNGINRYGINSIKDNIA